jgi:hypothetical protein
LIRWALWARRSRTDGVGGVADQRGPLIDRELAGDDGGAAAVAVLEDLEEIVADRGVERLEVPIIASLSVGIRVPLRKSRKAGP